MHVMRENWDDLRAVLFMVRHGSLAAAATALDVNYTTVARRIAQAEESYGVLLFERLPQGYVATEAGLLAASEAEKMEDAETGFRRALAKADTRLSGTFSITAPQLLIAAHLCHVIEEFLGKHPEVELTVRASNALLNLNHREADLAIRISANPGDTLVGRRLTGQQTASFASAEVARRIETAPGATIDWIGFTYWTKPPKVSLENYPNARIKMQFDDMSAVLGAAQAGLGVARMPMFLGRSAGLTQVPVLPPQPYTDIWAVAHRDIWASAKVTAFKECLLPYFKAHAAEFMA